MTPARRQRHNERAAVVTISAVATLPALLALVTVVAQLCVWWYGRLLADAAANDVVMEARLQGAHMSTGVVRAQHFLASAGSRVFDDVAVKPPWVSTDGGTVYATVTGDVVQVIPWFSPHVSETEHAPVERLTEGP
jgi:hypothetical protein